MVVVVEHHFIYSVQTEKWVLKVVCLKMTSLIENVGVFS